MRGLAFIFLRDLEGRKVMLGKNLLFKTALLRGTKNAEDPQATESEFYLLPFQKETEVWETAGKKQEDQTPTS